MEGDSVHALCGLEKSLRFGTQRKLVEHHGELWNSTQDGRSDNKHIRRVGMSGV